MSRPRALTLGAAVVGLVLVLPSAGHAAAGAGAEGTARILLALGVLLMAAKAGGLAAERLGQPAVLGEIVVGGALGSAVALVFGGVGVAFVRAEPTLSLLAEVGVLILLFDVGLETDLSALLQVGPSALLVAVIGVALPIALGGAAARWLMPDAHLLAHVFVGATLAATSVGITARVLKDLGRSKTREGQIILGAAIVDDVLGLIVLAVVSGAVSAAAGGIGLSAGGVTEIVLRAVVFLGFAAAFGHFLSRPLVRLVARAGHPEAMLVAGLGLCFVMAFVAERVGLAAIIGAFGAGIMLDPYGEGVRTRDETTALAEMLHPLSALFVPLFFVLMGFSVDVRGFASPAVLGSAAVLTLCALASKLAAGWGALGAGINRLAIGIGMVPRGEVGLIFAGIGTGLLLDGRPLLTQADFSSVVAMVLVTTLVAPIGLRWAFARAETAVRGGR
jgi:Kef-type K+ transport system membrane component KefB